MSAPDLTPEEMQRELATLRQRVAELEQQHAAPLNSVVSEPQAAMRLLQLIINNLPGAVFWKDTNLVYQGCNLFFAQVAGVGEPSHIVGKTDYDLAWTTEQAEAFRRDDRTTMDNDTPLYHIVEPQQQADGKQAWLDTNKVPLHDDAGQVVGILGTFEDITERKQIEEDLRTNKERFRVLIEAANVPTWIHRQGIFRYVNPATEQLLGYSSDELLQMAVWDIIHPDFLALVRQRAAERHNGNDVPRHYEIQVVRRDGTAHWVELHANRLEFDGEQCILVTFLDINQRKQVESERARLQEEVIEAQATALRELSTPLIPLSDHVVAMPLIGHIDTGRAQQVMDSLLEGVAQHHARTVILDITGVPVVDTQVALALMQAAQAVQLLGAQVILTGIRPDVAQSLVGLDIRFDQIITLGSLQAGIAYATRQRVAH
jgi:PAS domain S-box-containing protein